MRVSAKTNRINCWLLLCTLVVVASGLPVLGQEASGEQKDYEAGEVWLKGSRVYVYVGKTRLGHEHGVEGQLSSGSLQLKEGKGKLVFDMNTFTADTAAARSYVGLGGSLDARSVSKTNANMHGYSVLDVANFPAAEFVVSKVTALKEKSERGLAQYQVEGKFTLHGVTQPLSFIVDIEPKEGWLHVRGSFAILQTDYGITPFSAGFRAMTIANQLTIWGDLWVAERKLTTK